MLLIGAATIALLLLLVSALMVVPVATAQQLVRGFRATVVVALGAGVVASVSGVLGSYYADTAPGALIVVVALGCFALASVAGVLVRSRRRTTGDVLVAPTALTTTKEPTPQ